MIAHIQKKSEIEEPVIEHNIKTGNRAKILGTMVHIEYLASVTGIYHDFGKMRVKYADYIRIQERPPYIRLKEKLNHSSAGAIYVYQRYYKGSDTQRLTAQLIATAILSHHSLNDCLDAEGKDCFHRRINNRKGLDYEEVLENFALCNMDEQMLDECFAKAVSEAMLTT